MPTDAPLLSPICDTHFDYLYPEQVPFYYIPPSPPGSVSSASASPVPTTRMLKSSLTPDSDQEQLCLPTHQVFDLPEEKPLPIAPALEPPTLKQLSIPADTSASKREADSPAPSATKKPRAIAERINTKDFIPPDVSGLSKREARLVKNRAAAFLSRQRKREEFEFMEVYVILHSIINTWAYLPSRRVAHLEQENARLLALTQGSTGVSHSAKPSDNTLVSEIEALKAQLSAVTERERQLSAELASRSTPSTVPAIKVETPDIPLSSPSRSPPPPPHKSGASLGLMVRTR
jgi:hypothetical protein